MEAGELLRRRRLAHGLSQRELAERAGTHQSSISRIERGAEDPTVNRLGHLLQALGERLRLETSPLDPAPSRPGRGKSTGARVEYGYGLVEMASQRDDPASSDQ